MSLIVKALPFSIADMERSVNQRDYATYRLQLQELLNYFNKSGPVKQQYQVLEGGHVKFVRGGFRPFHNLMSPQELTDWCTRLAATITTFLSDTTYKHSFEDLAYITIFKTYIAEAFYISGYGSMDHILFNRGLLDDQNRLQLKTQTDIHFLIACYTLQSQVNVEYEMLIEAAPELAYYGYLGLLYEFEHPFSAQMNENFQALFKIHEKLRSLNPSTGDYVELMLNPWMGCSYWDVDARHEFKRSINHVLEKWLDFKLPPGVKNRLERNAERRGPVKRIVVASEKYISSHAMYRCYHHRIRDLKDNYELILVTAPADYDEVSAQDFHSVVEVSDSTGDIAETVKAIAKLEPDMIFWPSVGMSKWTILLSNLRIARYQVMAYGHPASAFSRHMDYGICGGMPGSESQNYQRFVQETLVPVFQRERNYQPHPDYTPEMNRKPLNDGTVRIAINSSLAKISYRFINLCTLLVQHSSVPLEFHFFMGHSRGWKNIAMEKSLRERIGASVVVYDPAPYREYMANMAVCDLALGTFPFGGTNTNVDLLLLGIPKIIYNEGSDFASFTDLHVMKAFDMPEILQANSEGELVASAIYLIHNAPERERLSQAILEQNPMQRLYNPKVREEGTHYIEAFSWILNRAETAHA